LTLFIEATAGQKKGEKWYGKGDLSSCIHEAAMKKERKKEKEDDDE